MVKLMDIYHRLPGWTQHIAVTSYGYILKHQRYGGNFQKYVKELEETQWLSLEKLREIQTERLRAIVRHAYENVPYYESLFNKIGLLPYDIEYIKDLSKIPILEKETLRQEIDRFVAKNISKRKLMVDATGGTTGTPLSVYITKDILRRQFAYWEARQKRWAGVKMGDKLATFLGRTVVPAGKNKPPFWRYNIALNQILFSSFHMEESNLKYYVDKFNSFKPRVIIGYPSSVNLLAKYILDYKKTIFTPKAILLTSESLTPTQRKNIEEAFGAKVFNQYGGAELVAFVSECEKGSLHVSMDYGVVELQRIKNKHEIIATTLINYAMPVLRYRTGDFAVPAKVKKCACGRELPLIDSIEGRRSEMLVTPEGRYIGSAALSLVFEYAKNVKQAQIVQPDGKKIIVRVFKEKEFSQNDREFILLEMRKRVGDTLDIEIEELTHGISRSTSGKAQFIISR